MPRSFLMPWLEMGGWRGKWHPSGYSVLRIFANLFIDNVNLPAYSPQGDTGFPTKKFFLKGQKGNKHCPSKQTTQNIPVLRPRA